MFHCSSKSVKRNRGVFNSKKQRIKSFLIENNKKYAMFFNFFYSQ